jgi:DNA replication ATP-dependent helicase Dna2
VDTDSIEAQETRAGHLIQNDVEAELLAQTSEALLACGVPETDIGVIALYRQQTKLLSLKLKERRDIEILTADRSQGRDKQCILMSFTRSNVDRKVSPQRSRFCHAKGAPRSDTVTVQVGDLLRDWRRINVCVTRAKSKLVMYGSRSTLQAVPILAELLRVADEAGFIYRLPEDALDTAGVRRCRGGEMMDEGSRASKKVKLAGEGVLKGRPVLHDLVNETW